jgi:hypothetical protein
MTFPGPCVICGGSNYELSCGGPTICPKCDCGNFDAATVLQQAKVIAGLREQLAAKITEQDVLDWLNLHMFSYTLNPRKAGPLTRPQRTST